MKTKAVTTDVLARLTLCALLPANLSAPGADKLNHEIKLEKTFA